MKKILIILFVTIQLFSCKRANEDFSFLKNYSSTELKYYLKAGFKKDRIQKWEKNIVVSFDKRFKKEFTDKAMIIIHQIDSILPDLKIFVSDINYNVLIIYEGPKSGVYGEEWTKYDFFNKCRIKESFIWLSPFTSSDKLMFNFCHEFEHALGLNHAYPFKDERSLMGRNFFNDIDEYESYFNNYIKIPEIDSKAIEIHYNEKIRCGMKREEFIRELKEDCGIQIEE